MYIQLKTPTANDLIPLGNAIMDWWIVYDVTQWVPTGGADAPELTTATRVIGIKSVAFGKLPNGDPSFGLLSQTTTSYDATGGKIQVWVYVKDKTKLANTPPLNYAVGILVGQDALNWYSRFLFHDDLVDVDNDNTNGWNKIEFDPVTESDFTAGSPDITALDWFLVGGIGLDAATAIPVGDMGLDFLRIIDVEGDYHSDVKEVYRYKIGAYQTAGTPIIKFAALKEQVQTKIYPIIESTLTIGIDVEAELPDEVALDYELGKLAADVQVALADNQDLTDFARYVEIKNWEFSVMEGTHTGILTVMVEIGYMMNQRDPTKQGL
jgi:hypothetical protein